MLVAVGRVRGLERCFELVVASVAVVFWERQSATHLLAGGALELVDYFAHVHHLRDLLLSLGVDAGALLFSCCLF